MLKTSRILSILLIATCAFCTLHYLFAIFLPFARTHGSEGFARWGSDLYPRWEGTRAVVLDRHDPYSKAITERIQIWYYGAPLRVGQSGDPQRFAYPGYTVLVLLPIGLLSFPQARILMTAVLVLCTTASLAMWAAFFKIRMRDRAVICTLAVLSWPFVEALYLDQPSLLVAFFLSGAAFACCNQYFILAGCLLALSSIKPQLALPLIASLLLWSWYQNHGRKAIASFLVTFGLLFGLSEWLIPGWLTEWIGNAQDYVQYTGARLSLQFLAGQSLGLVLTVLLAILAAHHLRDFRVIAPDSMRFRDAVAMLFAVTMLLSPRSSWHSYDEVLLFPAAINVFRQLNKLKHESALAGITHISSAFLLVWPFIATALLTAQDLLGSTFETEASVRPPTYAFFLVAPMTLASLFFLASTAEAPIN